MDMNKFESYLTRADSEYRAGFKSKAAKDRACSYVNYALEIVVNQITDAILEQPYGERDNGTPLHTLYWNLTDVSCRNFIKKSSQVLPLLGERATEWLALGEQCVALYTTYKNALINEVPVSPVKEIEVKVQRTIKEMMEERNEKFNRCLHLETIFGTMGVTANVHLVFGHKGTVYVRAFYYVMGVLTPLNTIIAAMQEADRQKLLG
ncbi:hypothetical protein phiA829_136 [Aeromonas phage phiA8-29]|uniref:Uncharacterized protein n=1 Tax=Aeromonas phage phiA8-29 TaxID=1978922 RepID=A0A1W6DYK4_9CAUD|nr:hypothetical protein HWB15_gp141 [Aeromonas phage phiA8-29]ARK07956.1 hypothetical protein phiA829_136 [Aeromonas phage phiA8-29]